MIANADLAKDEQVFTGEMPMPTFDFTITIDQLVEDVDVIDAFYGRLDDVSMFNAHGARRITFHRESATLDDALLSAVSDLQSFGYTAKQMEVEPACVGAE
jgi:hypothetical protein